MSGAVDNVPAGSQAPTSTQTDAHAARVTGQLRGLARGGALNLFAAVVSGAAGFVLVVLVTRGLSQHDAGVFFTATSVFLLATSVGQLGATTGLVYFVSRCRALGMVPRIRGYLRTAVVPVLLGSVALGAIVMVAAPQVASLITHGDGAAVVPYLHVLGLFVPVACLAQLGLAATRGLHTMRVSAVVENIGRPLLQVGLVAAVLATAAPDLLGWAWALPYAPAAVAGWVWWSHMHARLARRHQVPPDAAPDAPDTAPDAADAPNTPPSAPRTGPTASPETATRAGAVSLGSFWAFSVPRGLATVAHMAMQRLDIVLVAALRGPAEAAVYTAVTRFVVVGQMAGQAISTAVQPRLAAVLSRHEHVLAHALYGTATAWLVLLTWPLYLLFAAFGPVLLTLFGSGYTAGTAALTLLTLAMLISTACGMVEVTLDMAGRTTWTLGNTVLGLLLMVALDAWLIPAAGVLGAAIGWSVARVVTKVLPLALLHWRLGLHPFGPPLLAATLLCAGAFGLLPLVVRALLGAGTGALATSVALGTVVYLAGLLLLRHPLRLSALAALRRGRDRTS